MTPAVDQFQPVAVEKTLTQGAAVNNRRSTGADAPAAGGLLSPGTRRRGGGRVRPIFLARCRKPECTWGATDYTRTAAATRLYRHLLMGHDELPRLADCVDAVEELVEEPETAHLEDVAEESSNQQLMEL